VLFLDIETTGLHGGAGTVAFLVGIGYFDEAGAFRTRQFFLSSFAGERAMLHAVGEAVAGAALVVTYNGGSFDLPVMETRWLFHRLAPALEQRPHLDMLPPARRLWKEQLGGIERSCRLVALEQSVLGTIRVGDVPGHEVPTRYFEFVRTGDATPLEPVLEHNRLDLLSLAVLMARAQSLVQRGAEAAADSRECLALGRVYERAGRFDAADAAYRAALEHGLSDRGTAELAWLSRARLARRRRRYADAAAAWREVLRATDRRSPRRGEAIEALAVHHEHRERNLSLARALVQRALVHERDPHRREAAKRRLERLDRKLARLKQEKGEIGTPTWSLPWDEGQEQESVGTG
jgi:tetratricopeptide (TPR) repeat protein